MWRETAGWRCYYLASLVILLNLPTMNSVVQKAVERTMLNAASIMEDQVDAELHALDNMTEDDIDRLREKRIQQMKQKQQQMAELKAKGHGEYREVDEKTFFAEAKTSARLVCHFYRSSTERCAVVDRHLTILARKHIETKFIKVNAEKSPFLVERLKIWMLPTIAIVKNGKTEDYIVGFDDLGGRDDFPTSVLEWRLGCTGVIDYDGKLSEVPDVLEEKSRKPTRSIRGKQRKDDDSDDDLFDD